MNADQNSKFEMYERTIKLCNEHAKKIAMNAAFQEDKQALENLLPNIRRLSQAINAGNAYAETKGKTKDDMIAAGLDVCTNLKGYGTKMSDDTLVKMSTHTKSSLCKGKETDVLERCQNIADKARELLKELIAKRGMKESLLTNFESLLQNYKNIKSEPRSAIQERSALIKELDAEFEKADTAFELMVGGAVNLKGDADEFLMRFEKSIVIIAPRTSATKLIFIVQNGVTKEKITDYKVESSVINVTVTPSAARYLTLIPQKKGAKGETKEKGLGTDFVITSDGFEPLVLKDEKIKKGKTNTFKVELIPLEVGLKG